MSRLLVVDASVMRAAGESDHPVSSAARKTLRAILNICHRVAVTPSIRSEYRDHQSRFATKWQCRMAARQKPLKDVTPSNLALKLSNWNSKDRGAITKDIALLETAMHCDKILITYDDALRQILEKNESGKRLLKQLTWINPVDDNIAILKEL